MSVVSIKEIHSGRGGDESYSGDKYLLTDTRVFRVVTNSSYDSTSTVLASCPAMFSLHPTLSDLTVRRRTPKNESNSKLIWLVTIYYSNESNQQGTSPTQNPLSMPAVIEWNTEYTQRPFYKDKDGAACLNTAGDYYLDGIKGETSDWVVVVTKNVAYVPSWIGGYRNAVNSSAFMIDGYYVPHAEQAKMRGIRISKWQSLNGIWYRTIQFTIKIKADDYGQNTWAAERLDEGLYEIDSEDVTKRTRIMDDSPTPKPVVHPVLLDGSGKKLSNPSPATAVFNTHHLYTQQNFNSLPLT